MKSKKNAKSARRTAACKGRGTRKTERNEIRFIDLFAGIGGFRVALEAAGAKCVWSCEKDALAARWYRENHGDDPTGDAMVVAASAVPHHTILCGGFPCPPYSTQGKGRGLADPRGRVFYAIPRILAAKQPDAFILENVDSLLHRNHRWSHDRIVASLEKAGYVVRETVLNAREFGLPQSRRRLFMVGFRRSLGTVPFAWPKRGPLATNRGDFLDERVDAAYFIGAEERSELQWKRDIQRAMGNNWTFKFAPRTHVHALLSAPHTSQDNIILDPEDGTWRRLTPNEYRRLQGFPEGFRLPDESRHAYMLLGNSVAVPVVRAVAENVIAALAGILPRASDPPRSGARANRPSRPAARGAAPERKCRRAGSGGVPPSPLACYGAKGRLAPTIVKLFPPHQTYVEPFLGGGSVFFAKPPSPVEVVNDVHGDLVNFFRVLRDGVQRDRLIELVEGTPWSREEFCDALAARKAGRWKDDAERARLFLVATRQARNGVGRRPSD